MSVNSVARPEPIQTQSLKRIATALLPIMLILVWTAAVRLPFYSETDKDEFFFSVIASEWLRGGLPYVATFDIKPPGTFMVFAVAQALFGASLATIKGIEVLAIALGAYGLYRLVRANATERAAWWTAALFPPFSLAATGTIAASLVIQLPFLILSFAAVLAAVRDGARPAERLTQAFLAGLAIGTAGMMKQTAIFEATAVFATLCIYGERRSLVRTIPLFILGAALPAIAFSLYFLAKGHFREMFEAAVVYALRRTDSDVLEAYGPDLAIWFTPLGTFANVVMSTGPLIFLSAGAVFVPLRWARITKAVPPRLLIVAALWLAAAFAGVLAGRGLCAYYVLTLIPPLLILASALFCHGLGITPKRAPRVFALTVVAGIASIAIIDRTSLFMPNAFLGGDRPATEEVASRMFQLGLDPQKDKLLVLNRGLSIYVETGLQPPTPFFHPVQTLGVFHTPSPDPLGESLNANPRFIVIADPTVRHVTELRSRVDRALDYVAKHYRVAAVVNGARDSYTIYEFRG